MPLLDLPDRSLAWEMIPGDPGRPVLVFLHEGLGSIAQWKDFPACLCAQTACAGLVYDRRGHGGSSPEPLPRGADYLHAAARDELPPVLAALLGGRAYVIVGHSDGGSIGLLHAATRPAGLRGLITEAAHVFVEEVTLAGIRAAVAAHAAGKLGGLARHHGDKAGALFAAWSATWLSDAFRDWNLESALPGIACPLLVMQGEDDQYGTARQVEAIVGAVAGAEAAMIPACGHAPHHEQRAAVTARMAAFIERLAVRA